MMNSASIAEPSAVSMSNVSTSSRFDHTRPRPIANVWPPPFRSSPNSGPSKKRLSLPTARTQSIDTVTALEDAQTTNYSFTTNSDYQPRRISFRDTETPVDDHDDTQGPDRQPIDGTDEAEYLPRPRSFYTDRTDWDRTLGTWDVAALIVNKMIGAGFFTTVGTVLELTRSKTVALSLWIAGGIYSLISFSIYLEYGLNFPYNGGDLIYVDQIFPFPKLLSTVLYSTFFMFFATTAGNSIAFARHVIAAAEPEQVTSIAEMDKRLVNLISVCILTIVCLTLYFLKDTSKALNRWLMIYKIGLFLAVLIAGAKASSMPGSGKNDWNSSETDKGSTFNSLAACIYVVYSYQGWENANYVTGEIKAVREGTLRNGGFLGVVITTICYVMGTVGYFLACNYNTIVNLKVDLGMGQQFAEQAYNGHTRGFKICIALSAVGNLLAVIYTNSMVRKAIALQQFIPFYKFIGAEDTRFGTPGGALFLSWLTTLPFILAMPNSTDGYTFVIGIYSYLHLFVLVVIGAGIFRLHHVMAKLGPDPYAKWKYKFLRENWTRRFLAVIFICANLLVIIGSLFPRTSTQIKRWYWLVTAGANLFTGIMYWMTLWALQKHEHKEGDRFLARWLGLRATVHVVDDKAVRDRPGGTDSSSNTYQEEGYATWDGQAQPSIASLHLIDLSQNARPQSRRHQPTRMLNDFDRMILEARQDGTRRRVYWETQDGIVRFCCKVAQGAKDLFIRFIW